MVDFLGRMVPGMEGHMRLSPPKQRITRRGMSKRLKQVEKITVFFFFLMFFKFYLC